MILKYKSNKVNYLVNLTLSGSNSFPSKESLEDVGRSLFDILKISNINWKYFLNKSYSLRKTILSKSLSILFFFHTCKIVFVMILLNEESE